MSEEFALCWNNFTENLQTGFRSLFQQDSLTDVTLACEGKLVKAHKVVLSLCSPYFQQIFTQNPHPSPVVIMAHDMKYKLVSNLLEFMYLGAVNVEQSQLQEFMKIAEALQIKGLTTSSKDVLNKFKDSDPEIVESKAGLKRQHETSEPPEEEKFKEAKPNFTDVTDLTKDDDEFQIIPMPEISIVEPQYNLHNSKNRDLTNQQYNLKISAAQSLNRFSPYDYNQPNLPHDSQMKLSNEQVPNEVSESGSGITMLSSTSLLHGNCVFNRNNTVATQAGLKTYWLCKSYRISMCKARCITFKGKVISATGIHNHLPHMSNKPPEIPPGHTPNSFNPNSEFPMNNLSTSPSQQLHLPHHQPYMSQQLTIPNLEASTSETSHFKMEHI